LSYESRRKKRAYKRTEAKAKKNRTSQTGSRWFLIVAKHPGRCSVCRVGFGRGDDVVYRHDGQLVRCVGCGSSSDDSRAFRPSLRWERARARERKNTTSGGRSGNSASGTTTAGTLSP
jgi:hypothetical protein